MAAAESTQSNPDAPSGQAESEQICFSYDNRIVVLFAAATILWGIVAALLAGFSSVVLTHPHLTDGNPEFAFGRTSSLHLNAILFGFAANGIFAGIYYSVPRLCLRKMFLGFLGYFHFLGWQIVVGGGLVAIAKGYYQRRDLADAEWIFDAALASLWVVFFAFSVLMTILLRRKRHMYASLWFYIVSAIAVPVVFGVNSLVHIKSQFDSVTIFAGTTDAVIQSWYSQAILLFLAVIPTTGMMYYFIPRIARQPLHSYPLAVLQFWGLTCFALFSAMRLLHLSAAPEWLTSLGMLAGLIMWMPNWAGVLNGLFTLNDSRDSTESRASGMLFRLGLLIFAFASLETAITSIKSVGAVTVFTDVTLANFYALTLGWAGLISIAMIGWLIPKVFQADLWSPVAQKLSVAAILLGTLLFVAMSYAAGIQQSWMSHAMDDTGTLLYPEFLDIVVTSQPLWTLQIVGAGLIAIGMLLTGLNFLAAPFCRKEPFQTDECVVLKKLPREYHDAPLGASSIDHAPVLELAKTFDASRDMTWHHRWERRGLRFMFLVAAIVLLSTAIQILPQLIPASQEQLALAKPLTQLELTGREIFVREGCSNCHTQSVRAVVSETKRYGNYSKAEDAFFDQPSLWGRRRVGPDLSQAGGSRDGFWHWKHLDDPRSESEGSVMPSFRHLLFEDFELEEVKRLVREAREGGMMIPELEDEELQKALLKQAEVVAADIVRGGGPAAKFTQKAVALIAYLQRLGKPPEPKTTDG